ncbi:MAG: DUF459 domain-containing protein [Actinobacteria bacterium]|nr:DUF459 domain-containing protein [Actinomycetota bacterium]
MSRPPASDLPPAPRRPTPSERAARRAAIRRRRITALAVGAFLLVVVCMAVVIAVTGDGASSGPKGDAEAASPSAPPRRSPSPSPTPTGLPTPTAADPLRFFCSGDSMGGELGGGLVPIIHGTGKAKTVSYYKVSSGLVRTDFFDWFAYLRKYSKRYQAVVFMLGTNDAQSIAVADDAPIKYGTAEWKAVYRTRVGRAMDIMLDSGVRRVYWVGMPVMRSANFNKDMVVINAAFRDEAQKRVPAVQYVDTMSLFSVNGAYAPKWRQDDGVHFNIAGVRRLSEYVAGLVEQDWHLSGAVADDGASP